MVVNDRRPKSEQDEHSIKIAVYSLIELKKWPYVLIKLTRSAPTEDWEIIKANKANI